MGHYNESRAVRFLDFEQQINNCGRIRAIEIAGRLIGQNQGGVVCDAAAMATR